MRAQVADELQAYVLDMYTDVGTLCHPEGDALRCVACGHRCLLGEGKRGICKVRFNREGQLRVPFGYVAGLQCDPVEKKPFFHVLPGSDALTFGMLGCDYHCSYCFPGDTPVVTDRGPSDLADLFRSCTRLQQTPDAEIAYPEGLQAVAGSGNLRPIRAIFRHPYKGPLVILKPYYLPELRCTPGHRVYATTDPHLPPQPTRAGHLTEQHYLAIPRRFAPGVPQTIDARKELGDHQFTYQVRWVLSEEDRQLIAEETVKGKTSRQIGAMLGKDPSYIRHIRSKLSRTGAKSNRTGSLRLEGETIRFPNERRPGIAWEHPLGRDLARLFGLYCAEGCITQSKDRPNSYTLNLSFSPDEDHLVEETCGLVEKLFGVGASPVKRPTTHAVASTKASLALLFKELAGERASVKRVPHPVFASPPEILEAFLSAYVAGDGHRYENGKVSSTTVSRALAYGIAWIVLKSGHLPSVYDNPQPGTRQIEGRTVKQQEHQYEVVWYKDSSVVRKFVETEDHYLVPVRRVSTEDFVGDVYNMEVDEEHNYLAGFFLVSNCQNWLTSQALRDGAATGSAQPVRADQLVAAALREKARLIVSSYNEPLITAEWAAAVFQQAAPAGLLCAFVSNGNATPEALDYIRPWLKAYKVDLKGFDDRHYRTLGGTLKQVLDSIVMIRERGLWLEVVTLVIPGFNDAEAELRAAARFLASVSRDIPWHVTGFHKDYKMTDPPETDSAQLVRAAEIGAEEGLRFVYAGNRPGRVGAWEDTRCPSCGLTLVERVGYLVRSYRVTSTGQCPGCAAPLPGIWPDDPATVKTGDLSAYGQRLPRRVR